MHAHLLLRGEKLLVPTGYNLISEMYGEVTYVPRSEYAERESMLVKYAKLITENGLVLRMEDMHANFNAGLMKGKFDNSYQFSRKVAIVNEGASDAVALLGLIRLVDYLSRPDCFAREKKVQLVVDCGTGTTAIGLALAVLILRLPWEVNGVMLVGNVENFRNLTEKLVDDFKMLIQTADFEITQAGLQHCLRWTERPRPRKFGKVLKGEIQACQKIARETGILLDPVYTLAAWEVASTSTLSEEREVVMLHTGGTLGLFGLAQRYSSEFSP